MKPYYKHIGLPDGRSNAYGDFRDILVNVDMIRNALRSNQFVKFKCFSKMEADETRARLLRDEAERVSFSWIEFNS